MVDWISLLIPFAYLGILVASLGTFSSLYRKRKAAKSLHLAPYFPPHTPRDIYLTLLHTDSPKPPDSIIRSALILRACENVRRILAIRLRKPALQTLLARGSVGDDLWQRLVRAEKELEEEVKDVVNEANALANGWGQTIFQTASEMVNREMLNEKLGKIRESEGREKEEWIKRRDERRADALRDLGATENNTSQEEKEVIKVTKGGMEALAKKAEVRQETSTTAGSTVSDEDGVLVEKELAQAAAGGSSSGGGGKKKKKGKK
ncbi:putative translocation protein [Phaeomoniella chlamydospora]|uniref:Putative translocation protein n=1 Tax=Phaeomoniella chlamydospora TaxID=158046 RepID=A0A0G2FXB0_PHACM|nr:putative translocation protein [Phaeomoniella chlamydospora]